jgi:hypothetical protein
MRRHYPDGRALAVAGRTPKQITTAIGQVVLPKPIFPLEEKLEVVSHRAARSRIEHHGVPVVSRLQPSLAVVVSKYRSVLSCTCCTSKRTFAACAMNQCGADEGVDMGMSPGGNTSGTFTLITGRDRPRSVNATKQSGQSGSIQGGERRWAGALAGWTWRFVGSRRWEASSPRSVIANYCF